MNLKFLKFSFLVVLLFLVFSCSKNPFDIKLEQEVSTKLIRFDKELMAVDTALVEIAIDDFYDKYPVFFPTYTYGVIKVGGIERKEFPYELKRFVKDRTMREVNAQIQEKYEDVSDVKESIDKALSYYHHYFPEELVPDLYFMQSGFNQRIIVDSLVLGVALDMCLGGDNDYYKRLGLPSYMSEKLNRKDIALDAMRAIAWSSFIFEGEANLASNIIYEGKIQYLMDALFPDRKDYEKLSYTEEDIKWLNMHEEEIWSAVIQGEMLYQTDHMKIKNMIDNAPFTQAFGNDSPPKIGIWLGWRIVSSYMDEHPEVSVQDLMMNKDYIGILNESNYKP